MSRTEYFFEIYTKGPKGELGYDISVGYCNASSIEEAKAKIKREFSDSFDCFVQCYCSGVSKIYGKSYMIP